MKSHSSTPPQRPEKFPARSPHRIDDTAWFYEERIGVCVVAQVFVHLGGGTHTATRQVTVSWKAMCKAVDRYRRAKAKRRKK